MTEDDYASCIQEVYSGGLRPTLSTFDGVLYHGTAQSALSSITSAGWKLNHNWDATWVGPAVYTYENSHPFQGTYTPPNLPHRGANYGAWAAECHAKARTGRRHYQGPIAVVEISARIDRVLDLESLENDAFVTAVMQKIFRKSRINNDLHSDRALRSYVGKVIHKCPSSCFPDAKDAPQAFRLLFRLENEEVDHFGIAITNLNGTIRNFFEFPL